MNLTMIEKCDRRWEAAGGFLLRRALAGLFWQEMDQLMLDFAIKHLT